MPNRVEGATEVKRERGSPGASLLLHPCLARMNAKALPTMRDRAHLINVRKRACNGSMCVAIPQICELWYMECHTFRKWGQLIFEKTAEGLASPGLESERP